MANPAAVRGILSQLKDRCPSISGLPDRKLRKLLLAVRHQETYSATDTRRGRPTKFERELLDEVRLHLKAILSRETGDRISIQTFVGHYLPILDWPENVVTALARGDLSRLEAAQVARLTADRLGVKPREAVKIRDEIIMGHARSAGSQTALREKVREALGDLTLVSSEKMTEAVERVDDLLRVDPEDRRHLFYEQMKDFFFALRDIRPEEIDDAMLELMTRRADELMEVIHAIQWKRKQKEKPPLKFTI
ncbi:MAG: hypothetical protein ACREEM_06670 [Blastocatellia bacterium]